MKALAAMLLAAAAAVAMAWYVGGRLIEPAPRTLLKPGDLALQDERIPAGGHTIAAWWRDLRGASPIVLLAHPVRGNRLDLVSRARLLVLNGFSVLLIDLQAHGETPGEMITFGVREADDVRAALAWIRERAPGRRIGAVGMSLGGASMLLGKQPLGVDALVLEAVYPRLNDAVEDRIRIRLGPLAPAVAPILLAQVRYRIGVPAEEVEPIRHIAQVGTPVLIIAGSRDVHTTLTETRTLFDAARGPKSLWVVEGARHEDLLAYDSAGYERQVVGFLERYLGPTRHACVATIQGASR